MDLTGTIDPVTDTARLLDPFRLPRHARPTRYDVTLEPDLATAVFSGRVVIHVTIDDTDDNRFADRDELVLNAAELDVAQCLVDGEPAEHRLDDDTERLFIRPARDLVPRRAHRRNHVHRCAQRQVARLLSQHVP